MTSNPDSGLPQGGLIATVDWDGMYTSRVLEGSTLAEMLMMPPFRTLHFEKYLGMIQVSSLLRTAWLTEPIPEGLDSWMSYANQIRIRGQATSNTPNPSELHTPWRAEIYHRWNHVFYDGFTFLQEAGCGIGGFHPPSHDILPLFSQREGPLEKVWDSNVMLIPTYLAPGGQVRMFSAEKDVEGKRKEFGKFDEKNTTELWFLMRGKKVLFEVEEGTDAVGKGPVVVLVVGIGCNGEVAECELEV